jgi:outer membrane immunogenic protein
MRIIARLSTAAAAVMAASFAAQAADLSPPGSRVVYAPTWTGFYVGGSAGYGWSNSEVDPAATSVFCNPITTLCAPRSPTNALSTVQVTNIPPALFTHPSGGMLGAQAGYNYQAGAWVVGVETDISWTNINGTDTQIGGPAAFAVVGFSPVEVFTAPVTADERLKYLGTLRGRLGFVPADPLLVFVTGGLAYGKITSSTTITQSAPLFPPPVDATIVNEASTTRAGWTVGGGLEYSFAKNWSLKAEYLYFNLGSISYAVGSVTVPVGGVPGAPSIPASTVGYGSTTTDFKGNIVRFGMNYKFGNY